MWIAPEVKDPVLIHAPTRKSIACFGAVSLETGKFAYSLCDTFDAKTFETFLMLLLRRRARDKRMVIGFCRVDGQSARWSMLRALTEKA
jgi:hypothetical protein